LGAIAILVGFQVEADHIRLGLYDVLGAPTSVADCQRYISMAELLSEVPLFAGHFLRLFGMVGLRIKFGSTTVRTARLGLEMAVIGGAVAGIAALLMNVLAWGW
jgi:hypothetical protein